MLAFKTTLVASIGAFLIGAASVAPDMAVGAQVVNSDSAPASGGERKSGFAFPVNADWANFGPGDGAGYSALGIAKINGKPIAIYAFQNGAKLNDITGQGQGFADVFDSAGHLLRRFTFRENLNSPPQIMEYVALPAR